MIELRIISRLLDYPDAALWQYRAELSAALVGAETLLAADKQRLGAFINNLCQQPLLDAQAAYGELFDRGRALSLLLFEHVHGESRDRGQAMVDLMDQYQRAGLAINRQELPDYLPLYLEYLSQLTPDEAQSGLSDIATILALLGARLQQRGSDYALLFDLLLQLARSSLSTASVVQNIAEEVRDDTPQALDAVWEEEQVTFLGEQGCGNSLINQHQHRFAGAVAPQYLHLDAGGQR